MGYHVKFADPVNLTLSRLNDMDTLDVFNTVFVDAAGVFHFCGWSKHIQHFLEHEIGIKGDPMGGWQMSQFHGGQEFRAPGKREPPKQQQGPGRDTWHDPLLCVLASQMCLYCFLVKRQAFK